MKLLANENFPLTSVKILADAGFDIVAVGKDYAGILDSEVIELATFFSISFEMFRMIGYF